MTQRSMDDSSELMVSLSGGVLTLTLNRPARRNALSPSLYKLLLNALQDASIDPAIGAVIVTGASGAFCAGGDVARMAGAGVEPLSFEDKVRRLRHRNQISELLHTMAKPTIAMMSGAAAGAGLSLALACDMRIADDTAKFKTAFVNVGLSGDFGGHYFLPRLVGAAKARELYLTSPTLDAQQALQLGMVNHVVTATELSDFTIEIARKLANGPRTAIAHMKANLNFALNASLGDVLDEESWRHVRCTETSDHREATRAYVEKRAPRFGQTENN